MQNAQIWTGLCLHSSGAPIALLVLSFYVQHQNLLGAGFLDCSSNHGKHCILKLRDVLVQHVVLDYQWNLVSQTVTGNLQIQITFKFKHKTTTRTKVSICHKTLPQIMSLHAKDELTLSSLKVYCVYLSAFFFIPHKCEGTRKCKCD